CAPRGSPRARGTGSSPPRRRRSGSTSGGSRATRRRAACRDPRPARRTGSRPRRAPRPGPPGSWRTPGRQHRRRPSLLRASDPRRGPSRRPEVARSQRPAAGEAGVDVVPERDPLLPEAPAEVDAPAVALAGEVDQPGLGVPEQHVALGERQDLFPERGLRLPVVLALVPAAVRGDLLADALGRAKDRLTGPVDDLEPGAEVRELGVRLLDRVHALLHRHHSPRSPGSSPSDVIRAPDVSAKRPRRSMRTGNMPTAAAGSTSNSGLSPTYTEASAVTPARSIARRKILGSGFSSPSTPEMTRTPKNGVSPRSSSSRSSHSSKFETTPSFSPAPDSFSSAGTTSSNIA